MGRVREKDLKVCPVGRQKSRGRQGLVGSWKGYVGHKEGTRNLELLGNVCSGRSRVGLTKSTSYNKRILSLLKGEGEGKK